MMNRKTLGRLKSFPYSNVNEIPECIGVYFVCLNDAVIYVGSSSKIRSRLKTHHKTTDILRVSLWAGKHKLGASEALTIKYKACATIEEARNLENECICSFVPTLNWIESRENYIAYLEKKANVQFLEFDFLQRKDAA